MTRPATDEFRDAIRSDHKVITVADAWYDGELVAANLPVSDGEFTWDGGAPVPTAIGLTVTDPDALLVPTTETSPLSTYGQEINVRRGLVLPGGAIETVSLGWFQIEDVKTRRSWRYRPEQTVQTPYGERRLGAVYRTGGGQITVEAVDRMQAVADARFVGPEVPVVTSSCVGEIHRLCDGLLPIGPVIDVTDRTVPGSLVYEESRLDAVRALAAAVGATVYADGDGLLVIRAEASEPEPVVLAGGPDGVLINADVGWSRRGLYNAVVARGETDTDTAPVQAVALSTDGVTRWDGPMKRVPMFYSSPLLTSEAQAQAAAQTRLGNVLSSRTQVIEVTAVPDPTIECGDRVTVETPDRAITGRVVSIKMPLTAGGGPMVLGVDVPTLDLFVLTTAQVL